jgi:Tol biopolymer transport system component
MPRRALAIAFASLALLSCGGGGGPAEMSASVDLATSATADLATSATADLATATTTDGPQAQPDLAMMSTAADLAVAATDGGPRDLAQAAKPDLAQGTAHTLISIGMFGRAESGGEPSISRDGRYVLFKSLSGDLVANDGNFGSDLFRRDTMTGTTIAVSATQAGAVGQNPSAAGSLDATGAHALFVTPSPNLGGLNGLEDAFLRALPGGAPALVSASGNTRGGVLSVATAVASGGSAAFFVSDKPLGMSDGNNKRDVYRWDAAGKTLTLVSANGNGASGNEETSAFAISSDGAFAVFASFAANLVGGDNNGKQDVFLRDLAKKTTERVSVGAGGVQASGGNSGGPGRQAVSVGGRFVAFVSEATNLVPGDNNGADDVFVLDRMGGAVSRASVDAGGVQGNGKSFYVALSDDGRFVVFATAANLVPADNGGMVNLYVRDLVNNKIALAAVDAMGKPVEVVEYGPALAISGDGRHIAFVTNAALSKDDQGLGEDVYLTRNPLAP